MIVLDPVEHIAKLESGIAAMQQELARLRPLVAMTEASIEAESKGTLARGRALLDAMTVQESIRTLEAITAANRDLIAVLEKVRDYPADEAERRA